MDTPQRNRGMDKGRALYMESPGLSPIISAKYNTTQHPKQTILNAIREENSQDADDSLNSVGKIRSRNSFTYETRTNVTNSGDDEPLSMISFLGTSMIDGQDIFAGRLLFLCHSFIFQFHFPIIV